jgi:hypothetical protein
MTVMSCWYVQLRHRAEFQGAKACMHALEQTNDACLCSECTWTNADTRAGRSRDLPYPPISQLPRMHTPLYTTKRIKCLLGQDYPQQQSTVKLTQNQPDTGNMACPLRAWHLNTNINLPTASADAAACTLVLASTRDGSPVLHDVQTDVQRTTTAVVACWKRGMHV